MKYAAYVLLAGALLVAGCGGGGGGASGGGSEGPPPPPPPPPPANVPFVDTTVYALGPNDSLASAQEGAAITHHQLTLNGTSLAYTAKAGHLTAHDPQSGKAEASLFYVAYTLDSAAAAQRPVTFFYNGGPGLASTLLHMGSFGPRRLATGVPLAQVLTSFPEVDNAESLLDVTDLVFIDPPGTGLSEAIAPFTNSSFWSVDADGQVVRDFIARYIEANARTASPKFIFGESYGALRSAVLANLLESSGIPIKGVVLQSPILNYNTNCGVNYPSPVSCIGHLPTYAVIGAYHSLVQPPPGDAPAYAQQMRDFATSTYGPAVDAYLASRTQPSAGLVAQLTLRTGTQPGIWQTEFNLVPTLYQISLVAGSISGRYDARYLVSQASPLGRSSDPSLAAIDAPFDVGINAYLPAFLAYSPMSHYTSNNSAIASVWQYNHDGKLLPDSIPDLAAAITLQPKLQVLSLNGYYDLATPFFTTERDLARLGGTANVQLKYYTAGHMTYLDDQARPVERADLVRFYQSALAQ